MWKYRKLAALLWTGVLCLSLAACGGEDAGPGYAVGGSTASSENSNQKNSGGEIAILDNAREELLYFTEEVSLDFEGHMGAVKLYEDCLYYSVGQSLYCYSFKKKEVTEQELHWADAPAVWWMSQLALGTDGSIYSLMGGYTQYFACKFDGTGELVYTYELTEDFKSYGVRPESSWSVNVDADGRFYVAADEQIWVVSEDGAESDIISFDKAAGLTLQDMARTSDDSLYVAYSGNSAQKYYVAELTPDFVGKEAEDAAYYQKRVAVTGMEVMGENQLMVYDDSAVYEYDLAARTCLKLFTWEEAAVTSNGLQYAGYLSDGRMVVVNSNNSGKISLIEGMTEAQARERGLVEKEEITIGNYVNPFLLTELQGAVAAFNSQSDKYRVVMIDYGENAVDGAACINRLNNEIVSGEGPDLLGFGDFEALAKQGALVNLYEYLDKSENLFREDFFDNLLEAYQVDGVLTAIPREFTLTTLVGRSDIVGEEMGWTLEEMFALGEQYPDKKLYYDTGLTKRNVLRDFIRFYGEEFMDWEQGTCNFVDERFQSILRFIEQYPDDIQPYKEGDPSTWTSLATGGILLTYMRVYDFTSIQDYEAAFGGPITFIGYPTPEGVGCVLSDDGALAINANSKCKDGAWAFLEYFLQYDHESMIQIGTSVAGFSTYKPLFEKRLEEERTSNAGVTWSNPDGWSYTRHNTTQEEVDKIYALLENARYTSTDMDLETIILEEADSYFSGQKPLDTVVEIIQNRVQIYMDEQE